MVQEERTERSSSEVFILGAGFSRALSPLFPLTDELGSAAVERAGVAGDPRVPRSGFCHSSFERWLSRLAEDQPHLSVAENLDNQALFHRMARGIHDVLSERQNTVFEAGTPEWLYEFLSVLHARRSSVITLNYDESLEYAVDNHFLWDWGYQAGWQSGCRITSAHVLDELPPSESAVDGGHPAPTNFTAEGYLPSRMLPAATFRLLKLHGSLSWYWVPGDFSGTTLRRWRPSVWGTPTIEDDNQRRRILPGREPFVVPPTSAKTAYFRNPITGELWTRAFSALSNAPKIVLVGYSLPAADLTFTGMIEDAIANRDVQIEVVDTQPEPVCDRLMRLGVPEEQISTVDDEDPIETFVRRSRDERARDLVRDLQAKSELQTAAMLLVSWGNFQSLHPRLVFAVEDVSGPEPSTGDVVVQVAKRGTVVAREPEKVSALLSRLDGAERIVAQISENHRVVIVDHWSHIQPMTEELGQVLLVPAGRPSESS